MITKTFQDLVEFINSQPDEREVDMSESTNRITNCGCVMVQMARPLFPFGFACGWHTVTTWEYGHRECILYLDHKAAGFILFIDNLGRTTYAVIKRHLENFTNSLS